MIPTVAKSPIAVLTAATADFVNGADAAGTVRVYRSALKGLDAWHRERGLSYSDASMAEFVHDMHRARKAPATIAKTLAAVSYIVKRSKETPGAPDTPNPIGPFTKRAMKAARKAGADRGPGQVAGVQWGQADAAAAQAANGGGSLSGLRDAAMIAVASDGLLRVAELVAVTVGDVEARADGSGVLTIKRSKTDQEGAGAVVYLSAVTMKRVAAWREAGAVETGRLFRRIRRGDHVQAAGISDRSAREIVKARCADAGIDGRVSGHSLRVGSAHSLATAGASVVEMQTAGRWASPRMPGYYARKIEAGRGAVARLRYGS